MKITTPRALLWLAALATPLLPLAAEAAATAPDARPNVLLIILEDWGPHLACYGNKLMHTPHLDRLAGEGRR